MAQYQRFNKAGDRLSRALRDTCILRETMTLVITCVINTISRRIELTCMSSFNWIFNVFSQSPSQKIIKALGHIFLYLEKVTASILCRGGGGVRLCIR